MTFSCDSGYFLSKFNVYVTNRKPSGTYVGTDKELCATHRQRGKKGERMKMKCARRMKGRYVVVQQLDKQYLIICEAEVFGNYSSNAK